MKLLDFIKSGTKQEQKQKKIAVYAIIITAAALIITAITLCVTSLIFSLRADNSGLPEETENSEDDGGTSNGAPSGYVEKVFDESQLYSGNLILVSESIPVNASSKNTYTLIATAADRPKTENNTNTYTVGNTNSFKATPSALKALNSMLGDYYKQSDKDDNIIIASAYYDGISSSSEFAAGMSFEFKYFVDYKNDPTAKDGIHGVDKYAWLYNNAYKYGFVTEGTKITAQNSSENNSAANTFRYVGVEHATAMKTKGFVNLADYLDFLKANTSVFKALSVSTAEGKMKIYYCPSNAKSYVPEKNAYTVSGNNKDGYIISVNTSVKAEAQSSDTTDAQ